MGIQHYKTAAVQIVRWSDRRDASPAEDLIGTVVGSYILKRYLGHGECGPVFEAAHQLIKKPVAIKLLAPEFAPGSPRAEQFVAVGQRLARLRHDHLVSIYGTGQSGGLVYWTREYIDGRTLRETLALHQPLPPAQTLWLLAGAGRALAHLADQGITFGRLQERNIFIDSLSGEGRLGGFSFLETRHNRPVSSPLAEMPRLAQMLRFALDPAASESQPALSFLDRVSRQRSSFATLDQLLDEAEEMARASRVRPAPPEPPAVLESKETAAAALVRTLRWLWPHGALQAAAPCFRKRAR